MPSNKNRLYIALYPSGVPNNEERMYHWGFLIGPKNEAGEEEVGGLRCHVKNDFHNQWHYEELKLRDVRLTTTLLARVLIGKIEDEERLLQIFRSTPIVQGNPNWRCRTWVADVLATLQRDGGKAVGTSVLDWGRIEQLAREYVRQKTTDGRYRTGDPAAPRPTYDMILNREIVP